MTKRHFLFREEFYDVRELIGKLEDIHLYARVNGHPSPRVELMRDGDASCVDVFEETLSDGSTQLVVMLA